MDLPLFLENENKEKVLETIKRVHVVDAEIPFLLGWESLESEGAVIDISDKTITFKKSGNKFNLKKTMGGHGFLEFSKPINDAYFTFDA